jgi:hypothetical protein
MPQGIFNFITFCCIKHSKKLNRQYGKITYGSLKIQTCGGGGGGGGQFFNYLCPRVN